MTVRYLRAFAASLLMALHATLMAATPTFDDGSEADVYYYAEEPEPAPVYRPAPIAPGVDEAGAQVDDVFPASAEMAEEAFEPGVVEPSAFMHGNGGSCSDSGCDCGSCDSCADCDSLCSDPCCDPCCSPRFYARGEYLMWWMKGGTAPPLLTTSPDGTPQGDAGVLPDAEILFPTDELGTDGRSGGRFTLGYWFDDCQTWGIEGNYFFLDKGGDGYFAESDLDGNPIISRPFYNVQTDAEDAATVFYPNVAIGTINIASSSDILGAEANLRGNLCDCGGRKLDFIGGYRFLQVHESIGVFENQMLIGGGFPVGTEISTQDKFVTRNEFHGGQLGLQYFKQHGRWTWDVLGKVALGSWNQQVRIAGFTVVETPNAPTNVYDEGFLALDSNSGNYQRNRFAAIPEVGVNLHYQLTRCWKVNVGYTFIYLSNIVRPGNNIDRRLDPDQFPPPLAAGTFPEFNFKQSDAWLQGVNVGVECRF